MSLQVLVAHTGQRLRADPTSFGSLDAFKSWLSDALAVNPTSQILLTAQGKQAKLQALLIEACLLPSLLTPL
jgi:autophagy-related protein 11